MAGTRFTRLVGGLEANFFRIIVATFLLGIYAHTFGSGFSGQAMPIFFFSGIIGFGIGDLAFTRPFPASVRDSR